MYSKFAAEIQRTIAKYEMLTARDRVLAGVSGGADSVCLALVLKELGCDLAIAHLNHALRGRESDEDQEFTRKLADKFGVQFFARVGLPLNREPNLEAAGREARKTFFQEIALEHGFTKIALAHTQNDRVETFLLNLLRGSGSEGLASMAPSSGNIVRPLIETSREEIEAYLKEQNKDWRTDSTNLDTGFARNRLRHVVIPELASKFNANLSETLARTVEILGAEGAWMGELTDQWLENHGTKHGHDFVIPVERLEPAPVGFVRRVLRAALRTAGSDLHDVSFEQIEAVRGLLSPGKSGKVVEIPGGLKVAREFGSLVIRRKAVPVLNYDYELKIPGSVHIPELGKLFTAEIIVREARARQGEAVMNAANDEGPERVFVDAESIGRYVRIRNWNPGDYYRPVGLPGGKLKKLFQRARIPRGHRTGWPVIVAESTIVWVASFPVSREFAPRGHSEKKVVFEALRS